MESFKRILELKQLLKKKSFFLLGPRSTGKSYLIRTELSEEAVVIDLLRSDLYLRLLATPSELEGLILPQIQKKPEPWIVIDEIQKIPALLDEVHRLIEERNLRFLLTG